MLSAEPERPRSVKAPTARTPPSGHGESDFRLLYFGPLVSYADRFAIPPILLSISRDLDASLAATTAVATLYFFSYGAMQLLWGLLSDRLGRVRVMRSALAGMAVANLVSAVAPTLPVLVAAKAVTGGFAGALLPTSLVYVGDRVPFARRQQAVANVLAAGAIGTVAGTLAAGLFSRFTTWRLAFLFTAATGFLLVIVFRRLPESLSAHGTGSVVQLKRVLARPWALFLLGLAVMEGAVILGFFTFLAPALEAHGETSAVAGFVVAAYGVAVFAGTVGVKSVIRRASVSPAGLIVSGGALLLMAYLVASLGQGVPNILAANLLLGAGFALLHSTLQTWATELAPESRGTATSLFVTAVFTGAALGAAAMSGLADARRYGLLFLVAAGVTLPVVVIASAGRARYRAPATESP